jgi:DNA-binding NarL/FixJ family response regulator
VEDHPETTQALADILSLEPDFAVIGTAANGLQGLQQALMLKPDIIIMNVRMPVMDGIEATRQLIKRRPDSIVVMESLQDDAEMIEAAFDAGAKAYFVKPIVNFEEFYTSLRLAYEMVKRKAPAAPIHIQGDLYHVRLL